MTFLVWVYKYQYFVQIQHFFAQSPDCMTATFRTSAINPLFFHYSPMNPLLPGYLVKCPIVRPPGGVRVGGSPSSHCPHCTSVRKHNGATKAGAGAVVVLCSINLCYVVQYTVWWALLCSVLMYFV